MNFIEKKNIHDKLLGVTHLGADIALLRRVAPTEHILRRPLMNPMRDASEVLWLLLDHVSAEDILANRRCQSVTDKEAAEKEAAEKEAAEKEAAEKEAAEKEAADKEAAEKEAADKEAAEKAAAEKEAAAKKIVEKKSSSKSKNIPK